MNTASLPPAFQIDLTFLTLLSGTGVLIVALPIAALISVIMGHITAIAWEMQTAS